MKQRRPFIFQLWKIAIARNNNIESVTGFKRLWGLLYWRRTITKAFAAGYAQCKADVLAEIHLTQDATATHKPKTWESGFEKALEFIARKVEEKQPK